MRYRTENRLMTLGLVAFVLLFVGAIVFGVVNATHMEDHTNCVVNDKDRTTKTDSNGNSSSDARIYTDNCGVFQVADSLLSFTWSSADTYNSIKVGETYDFTTRGYRIPFFSAFPNIVEVRKS